MSIKVQFKHVILFIFIIILSYNYYYSYYYLHYNFFSDSYKREQAIPKRIYQTWFTRKLPSSIESYKNTMLRLNPGYSYHLYDDNDIDEFIRTNYSGRIYTNFKKLKIITSKTDFWRYLILYKFGGIYIDMDSMINTNLYFINHNDEAIITKEKNPYLYLQWCLMFNKNHPILKEVIDLINYNIENNLYTSDILNLTGPGVYTKAINNVHERFFMKTLNWSSTIKDEKYENNYTSYRIYGFDFNNVGIKFKYKKLANLLSSHKSSNNLEHWRHELHQRNETQTE